MHQWLAQCAFQNAIAIPTRCFGEAFARAVMRSESAMTKSIGRVFKGNQQKTAKIGIAGHL
jgi:hypothetical protein